MTATTWADATVRLLLPEQWVPVQMTASGLDRLVADARQLLSSQGAPDDQLAVTEAYLRRGFRQMSQAGVVVAASFLDMASAPVDDPGGTPGEPLLLSAGVTVATRDDAAMGGAVSAPMLRAAMRERQVGDRLRALAPPFEVPLPAGLAVYQPNIVRVSTADPAMPEVVMALDRYALPIDGGLVIVDFHTANLGLIEDYRPWFRQIVESVEVRS